MEFRVKKGVCQRQEGEVIGSGSTNILSPFPTYWGLPGLPIGDFLDVMVHFFSSSST